MFSCSTSFFYYFCYKKGRTGDWFWVAMENVTATNARARKNNRLLRAFCVSHCIVFGWASCRNRWRRTSNPSTRRSQGFEVIVHIPAGINKCYWLLWWLGGLVILLARVRQRPCIRHHDAIRKRANNRHCCSFVCLFGPLACWYVHDTSFAIRTSSNS